MAKVGDIIRYLNAVGGGRIVRIDGATAYVDDDGFETPVLLRDCVVVSSPTLTSKMAEANATAMPKTKTAPELAKKEPEPFVETAAGEKLNIVLAYEAADLKHLSGTTYDCYLVNDSNYHLMVTYLTRGDDDTGWTTRWAGTIEAGMQEFLCEVEPGDLVHMDRIAVQYLAYKPTREFELKGAASVEQRLDTKKFFKLHCFQQNPYFDDPVIALQIARNDAPAKAFEITAEMLEGAKPKKADRPTKMVKKRIEANFAEPLVIDLHINELVDTTAGLSNSDMLNLQIDKFREVMDANLHNHGRKIIFIHGKGEGVLRKALLKELGYRYKEHDVQDASFREYGFGATQVKIK